MKQSAGESTKGARVTRGAVERPKVRRGGVPDLVTCVKTPKGCKNRRLRTQGHVQRMSEVDVPA